ISEDVVATLTAFSSASTNAPGAPGTKAAATLDCMFRRTQAQVARRYVGKEEMVQEAESNHRHADFQS
ncbi:MAG: hypothetical protein AAFY24_27390, partial [Pseudomonadota bacterium]